LIANICQINAMPYTKLCSSDINTMYTKSDAHAQRIMDNGVIIVVSREFERPSCWYYRMLEGEKCELGVVTYGIASI
jgi:hypothetical protein